MVGKENTRRVRGFVCTTISYIDKINVVTESLINYTLILATHCIHDGGLYFVAVD